jgi:outer membrane protein OmpA-like peptidoglycan-associated protein
MSKSGFGIVALILSMSTTGLAQRASDAKGAQDHPAISRVKGSVIEFHKVTTFGTYKLPLNDKGKLDFGKPQELTGKVTRIQYSTSKENNPEFVLHNYKAAFKDSGFTILTAIANEELGVTDRSQDWDAKYYGSGGYWNGINNGKFGLHHEIPNWKNSQSFIAASGNVNGKDVYFAIYAVENDKFTLINQDVIETGKAETGLVTVEKLSKGLATKGHIAIYDVLFDSGKAAVKPKSKPALEAIAQYVKNNTGTKFFIVGHTDNTGNFASNMALSKKRAQAVMKELVTKHGVNATQLAAHGVASLVPVTSNKTDDGKAMNRRVEIVVR